MNQIETASIDEKRTTEFALGEFGFCLQWKVTGDHWVDVRAVEIIGRDGETKLPIYNKKDWVSSPDPVESPEDAEPYLEGHVKWDGCSEFEFGRPHFCGSASYVKHCKLLKHIWFRAFDLMGREPYDDWSE